MKPDEFSETRTELDVFLENVFASPPRRSGAGRKPVHAKNNRGHPPTKLTGIILLLRIFAAGL